MDVHWWSDGRRCRRASASLAWDHFRLFRKRFPRYSAFTVSQQFRRGIPCSVVLGWDINNVVITISVPVAKLERLRDMLSEWPSDREVASEDELGSLVGRLLHLCEVVRPGKKNYRRILNHLGLCPPFALGARGSTYRPRARHRLHGSDWILSSMPTNQSGVCWWQEG